MTSADAVDRPDRGRDGASLAKLHAAVQRLDPTASPAELCGAAAGGVRALTGCASVVVRRDDGTIVARDGEAPPPDDPPVATLPITAAGGQAWGRVSCYGDGVPDTTGAGVLVDVVSLVVAAGGAHGVDETADVARILQLGLAPATVDRVGDLAAQARYRTGGLGDVGGDWYDVLDLPGDGVAVVIGDVAGHGIVAATTMGHLRHAARAYLLDERSPACTLKRLNLLVSWLLPGEIATALVAIFDDDSTDVRLASAGHLPPLDVGDGRAAFVEAHSGPALGVTENASYTDTTHAVGDRTLLLFTDGLVERRGEAIDAGLSRLAKPTARHGAAPDLVDRLLDDLADAHASDDLAVVAVRRASA